MRSVGGLLGVGVALAVGHIDGVTVVDAAPGHVVAVDGGGVLHVAVERERPSSGRSGHATRFRSSPTLCGEVLKAGILDEGCGLAAHLHASELALFKRSIHLGDDGVDLLLASGAISIEVLRLHLNHLAVGVDAVVEGIGVEVLVVLLKGALQFLIKVH